jgi:hypothetical protein
VEPPPTGLDEGHEGRGRGLHEDRRGRLALGDVDARPDRPVLAGEGEQVTAVVDDDDVHRLADRVGLGEPGVERDAGVGQGQARHGEPPRERGSPRR